MSPRPHEQALGGRLHLAQCDVAFAGVASVGVVPAAEVKGWHVGVLGVILGRRVASLLPVVVVIAVGQDVYGPPLVRWQPSQDCGPLLQGKLVEYLRYIVGEGPKQRCLQSRVGRCLLAGHGHLEGIDHEALLEGAVLSHGAVVIVGRPNGHYHRRQVRRVQSRESGLVAPGVGVAHRADLAVAPRLPSDPLDRVVPVGCLLGEGVPLALGLEPAAHVLYRDDVASAREELALRYLSGRRLVVGGPLQDGWEPPVRLSIASSRIEDVRGELDAVPRRDHNVRVYDHSVPLMRALVCLLHRMRAASSENELVLRCVNLDTAHARPVGSKSRRVGTGGGVPPDPKPHGRVGGKVRIAFLLTKRWSCAMSSRTR